MQIKPEDLLSDVYADKRRSLIGEKAMIPKPGKPQAYGTVYLAAADAEGNMVSFIQSNYMGFGSGLVVPGTGIALQNRGNKFLNGPKSCQCITGRKTDIPYDHSRIFNERSSTDQSFWCNGRLYAATRACSSNHEYY